MSEMCSIGFVERLGLFSKTSSFVDYVLNSEDMQLTRETSFFNIQTLSVIDHVPRCFGTIWTLSEIFQVLHCFENVLTYTSHASHSYQIE